jgi:hypothetical protein
LLRSFRRLTLTDEAQLPGQHFNDAARDRQ